MLIKIIPIEVIRLMKKEILEFYKGTSLYTDLGLYKDFAKSLPNNIEKLKTKYIYAVENKQFY